MKRFRVTIAGMMIVVALAAAGAASLARPSLLWASGMYSLALAVPSAGAVFAVFGRGRPRAFGGGAAIFGLGYLALVFGPTDIGPLGVGGMGGMGGGMGGMGGGMNANYVRNSNGVTAPPLITTVLLDQFAPKPGPGATIWTLGPTTESDPSTGGNFGSVAGGSTPVRVFSLQNYRRAGHSLASLALAAIGGGIGAMAVGSQRRDPAG